MQTVKTCSGELVVDELAAAAKTAGVGATQPLRGHGRYLMAY